MDLERLSIGVPGALGPDVIARLATAAETGGFAALWVNDTPDGDAIAALHRAAEGTTTLRLGVGVVPLDRRPVRELVAAVQGLPASRVLLGLGVGAGGPGSLARMSEAVRVVREETEVAPIVGALGPRLRRLGAEEADGLLLNWLTPEAAADQRTEARNAAAAAGRPMPGVVLYARTISDPAARLALEAEASRYGSYRSYAANFERLGIAPMATTLPLPGTDGLAAGVSAYLDSVDELVLRAVPANSSPDGYLRFLDEVRAALD